MALQFRLEVVDLGGVVGAFVGDGDAVDERAGEKERAIDEHGMAGGDVEVPRWQAFA